MSWMVLSSAKPGRIGEAPSWRRRAFAPADVTLGRRHAVGAREQHQREDADAGDDRAIEHDAAAPADGDDAETDGGRDRHLADVAGEIVDAERGPSRRGHVGARDQRRGDRVLHGRADPRQQDQAADGRVALGRRQQGKGEPREERSRDQQRPLAHPLRQHARRQLQERQRRRVGHAQGADLHVGEAEGLRPDGEQHVKGVADAVVHEVDGAGGRQRAAPGRGPRPGIPPHDAR